MQGLHVRFRHCRPGDRFPLGELDFAKWFGFDRAGFPAVARVPERERDAMTFGPKTSQACLQVAGSSWDSRSPQSQKRLVFALDPGGKPAQLQKDRSASTFARPATSHSCQML